MAGKTTSIRDTLVFTDHAKLVFPGPQPSLLPDVEARCYPPPAPLRPGKRYTVVLSHATEDLVHVQLLSRRGGAATLRLPGLMEEMAKVYGGKHSQDMWGLGTARPGVVCAAWDSRDELWYRARVERVVRARIVLVTYVDFGNRSVVSQHRLLRLFPQFMRLPEVAQAVRPQVWLPNLLHFLMSSEGVMTKMFGQGGGRCKELALRLGHRELGLEVVGEEGEVREVRFTLGGEEVLL